LLPPQRFALLPAHRHLLPLALCGGIGDDGLSVNCDGLSVGDDGLGGSIGDDGLGVGEGEAV